MRSITPASIDAARHIAQRNGIANIEVHQTHSPNFNLPEKVDVIIHEQIGSDLFNENMIETLVRASRAM